MCDKMAISVYILKTVEKDPFRPGGERGDGPPEGKFSKLGGKVNFGVLSSKLNVIRAKRGPSASL